MRYGTCRSRFGVAGVRAEIGPRIVGVRSERGKGGRCIKTRGEFESGKVLNDFRRSCLASWFIRKSQFTRSASRRSERERAGRAAERESRATRGQTRGERAGLAREVRGLCIRVEERGAPGSERVGELAAPLRAATIGKLRENHCSAFLRQRTLLCVFLPCRGRSGERGLRMISFHELPGSMNRTKLNKCIFDHFVGLDEIS